MQKKQINKEIIHKFRMKLRTLKLEDKLDVFPIENTFMDIPFEKCTLFGVSVHPYPA